MPSHRRVRQIISTQWLHQSITFQGHFERKHMIPALYPVHGRRRVIMVVAVLILILGTTVTGRGFFQSPLGKYILTGYTDHVQLNLGEPENLEMVAIEDNEKNTMETGAEPDSEEDFEFVCKKPQWVPEGYTLENEVHEEEWGIYEQCYTIWESVLMEVNSRKL